jgi:kynurenine formamidase
MKGIMFVKNLLLLFPVFVSTSTLDNLYGQTRSQGPWWPNKLWGADDQSGGSNWITPEKVLKAVSLVKTGQIYDLGHIYERNMPMVGQRSFNLFIPSFPTYAPTGKDSMVFNDEYVTSEIGQVGTQFDGPGHPGRKIKMADGSSVNVFYNGFTGDEMRNPYGLKKLGVENVKPIITRGILIDLASYKGVAALPEKYEITLADIRGALAKQHMKESDIEPGDALLFDLGWWKIWPDKKTVEAAPPYANLELINWIISLNPCMVGSDLSLDAGPDFLLHENLILKNGIFNLEFMNFETLPSENKKYTFMFIFTPLKLKGATGSPGRPLAIY